MDEHIHPEPQTFLRRYVFSLDHKVIGIQYFITCGIFMLLAGMLAELIRVQLMRANGGFMSADVYNQVYSMHGSTMVWFVVVPLVTGAFGNYVFPLQIGARDVAFPWLNMISFWLFPIAGLVLFSSFLVGAPSGGWVEYPPLSLTAGPGVTLWCIAILLVGVGTTLTGINFLATALSMRAPGMTFTRMPLFCWAQLATAPIVIISTTALSAAVAALLIERTLGVPFFDPAKGGSPLMWEHMFWFYSHPAVYIMILPIFGIVSEIFPVFARKPIFGYKAVAFSSMTIALLGFCVWAHHMFASGLAPDLQVPFMIMTFIIAVPTGVKIFAWLATLWRGSIHLTPAMLFSVGFIITFTIGGISGVFLGAVPFDFQAHGTYFIVAHLHYVLVGGSLMGALAGIHFWFPKMSGRMLNERMAKWTFWLFFIGVNGTFFPMHILGLLGMPRRVPVYDAQFQNWNDIISICSFFMTVAIALFIVNVLYSLRCGKKAGANPWGGRTLEWQIASPPPYYNFATIPTVYSRPYSFNEPLPYANLK